MRYPKQRKDMVEQQKRKVSWTWFLLPIFLSIIGGMIGYYMLQDRDKQKAKGVLYVGIVVAILQLIGYFFNV